MPERLSGMRARIGLALTLLAALALIVQGTIALWFFDNREESFVDAMLAQQMAYSLSVWPEAPASAFPNTPDMRLHVIADGSFGDVPAGFRELAPGPHEVRWQGREFHLLVAEAHGRRFILSYDVADHEARWRAFLGLTLGGFLAFCLVLVWAGARIAGHLAGRLERLAARIQADAPGPYSEGGVVDEIDAVAAALDRYRMLQAETLERERAFAANLSHELRTPLTAIRTDAELLASLAGVPEAVGRRGQRITAGVDRIAAVMDSLLVLARQLQPGPAQTVELAGQLSSLAELLALTTGRPAKLICEFDPALAVRADPAMLDLVLRNVLDNALRHGRQGQIICSVAGTTLSVRDDGPGFAEADLGRVFERHHSGRPQGSGLGLAIVRHVCSACGWQATAANHPAGGGMIRIDFAGDLKLPGAAFTESSQAPG